MVQKSSTPQIIGQKSNLNRAYKVKQLQFYPLRHCRLNCYTLTDLFYIACVKMNGLYVCEPCRNFKAESREQWVGHIRTLGHELELGRYESSSTANGEWEVGYRLRRATVNSSYKFQWVPVYNKEEVLSRCEIENQLKELVGELNAITMKLNKLVNRLAVK